MTFLDFNPIKFQKKISENMSFSFYLNFNQNENELGHPNLLPLSYTQSEPHTVNVFDDNSTHTRTLSLSVERNARISRS